MPGRDYFGYSMLQMGCLGIKYADIDICPAYNIYLKPISKIHDKGALKFLNLNSDLIRSDHRRIEPLEAMLNFIQWINQEANGKTPVLITDNSSFDPVFIKYYLEMLGSLNIGNDKWARDLFSRKVFDLVGVTAGMYGSMRARGGVFRKVEHTHNAVEDATGNAYWFITLLKQGFQIE